MKGILLGCPAAWNAFLPPDVFGTAFPEMAEGQFWDLLALTPQACQSTKVQPEIRCRILLLPGNVPSLLLEKLHADYVVSYGLSPQDSLTLSSLTQPVLCIQRRLPRPDGDWMEPQELPLPPCPAEELLPLLGVRLLCLPGGHVRI